MYQLLKELCEKVSPSGFEQDIQRFIIEQIKDYADEYHVDPLGNVIAKVGATQNDFPSVLLAAHSDEIGFIVKKVESNGTLRFEIVGGFDDRILLAQPVMIKSNKGYIHGVIGALSVHYMKWDDPKRIDSHRELYIDIGARSAEDAKEMGIEVGQPISYGSELKLIGSEKHPRVVGKALDDRAGCALLIKLLQDLKKSERAHGDVYCAFTVQEEVGLRGASILTPSLKPDFAIAIDTTPTSDTYDVLMKGTRVLGDGPCIKIADKSLISHPLVTEHLKKAAARNRIPYQLEVFMGIGTDGGAIHMTSTGVSTGVVSIPSRYTHSPVEVVDLADLENSFKLIKEFIYTANEIAGKSFVDTY
ncbi:M42 family metallopeptidase [Rossellomorea sp. BNER]|uniref:M42 family metallopeptidase n=1 Tax=Rossellomorea sp. BNER TaxID=2962031 RepID=UPI003AF26C3C|nr:M42 family metallopeptidase [Rossellomorea sp. BNER]